MKLTDVKPIIIESEDDEFGNVALPSDPLQLMRTLSRKLAARLRERSHIVQFAYNLDNIIPGIVEEWNYPGGEKQLKKDVKTGAVIFLGNDSEYVAPNTPENQILKQRVDKMLEREKHLDPIISAMSSQVTKLRKTVSTTRQATQANSPVVKIPEKNVPKEVVVNAKRKFDNPYWKFKYDRYAGSPAHFAWTPQMLVMYHRLEDIFAEHGIPGFTTIYAGTLMQGTSRFRNFAVIGANGKFVWRKYDMGGGSGQNDVYINGYKTHTSSFFDEADQDSATFNDWMDALKAP